MSFLSDYEKRMLKNREENKKVLASLGLDKPFFPILNAQRKVPTKQGAKRKRSENDKPRKAQRSSADSLQTGELVQSSEDDWRTTYGRRRSGRLMGKEPGDFQGLSFEEEDEEEEKPKRIPRNRENIFGQIPGIEVGTAWSTRLECSGDGVHRPTVAGIHGNALEGCYSLALSGGYEDDVDYGDCFTYTGEGGRDLKGTKANPKNLRTAPQSKDQTLTRGNLALTKNVEKGRPVRVIRGYKLDSPFAPEEGYRYDGLYTVEKYWQSVGLSGFMVYKFALKRSENQPPGVWHTSTDEDEDAAGLEVSGKDNTSKNNKDSVEISSVADHSGEDNAAERKSNVNGANENGVDENCANVNGEDVSSKQQDDENDTEMNASEDENVERKNHESIQDSGGYGVAAHKDVNSNSGPQDGSDARTVEKDENDDDDNDERHVTNTTRQDDRNVQANAKATQDDDDDEHPVTNATRQDDSNAQANAKATQDDDDDGHHVSNATRQDESKAQSNVKATQDKDDDDGDNDEHHVTNATRQDDSNVLTSMKTTQGNEDDDGDKIPMKSATQDQDSEEKNAQVEN